jgi:glycerol-3-phosphate acyltransferase PlsY
VLQFAILLIIGYFLGSVPAAHLMAKYARGIDLRSVGSGNVGFTNLARTTSVWLAIPVLIFDIGKAALVVYIARLLNIPVYQQILIGAACMAGHSWPVFLDFNGGRGILTAIGGMIIIEPVLAIVLIVQTLLWAPFKKLAIGTLLDFVLFPVFLWFGDLQGLSALISQPVGSERLAVTLAAICLLFVMALRRLTAAKSPLSLTVPTGVLILNRLLYDRDIRDREAWLNQRRQEDSGKTLK